MHWIDITSNTGLLLEAFNNNVPSLRNAYIHDIRVNNDGTDTLIRFDLAEYPENPPAGWKAANTLQITLALSAVQSISLEGWASKMIADIDLAKNDDGSIQVSVGPIPRLDAIVGSVSADRISRYIDSARPPR